MISHQANALRFAAAGALSATLLGGCAGGLHLSRVFGPSDDSQEEARPARGASEKAVARAEKAVEKSPRNASLRGELGMTYLRFGRFDSAAASFDAAMALGDNSGRTALSLALAKIGSGHSREAVAILDDWRDSIPAADLGLALALAGESGRGVAVLADSMRGGDNTAKLRQNLGYAYALDGRWREARAMVEQDVPGDEVDQRISSWAMQAKPGDYQQRVASLIGAPVRSDPGLPKNLALETTAGDQQLAAEATASPVPAKQVATVGELPAVGGNTPAAAQTPAALPASGDQSLQVYTPPASGQPVAVAAPQAPVMPAQAMPAQAAPTHNFESAFAGQTGQQQTGWVATPPAASQQAWVSQAPAIRPVRPQRTVRVVLPAPRPVVQHSGTHLVQLGSFASPQGARRGWGILAARNGELRTYRMVITPVVVRGKNFWRVAAAGFDAASAPGMCATVRNRGGVCFAYASDRAPATDSTRPFQGAVGPQMARRR